MQVFAWVRSLVSWAWPSTWALPEKRSPNACSADHDPTSDEMAAAGVLAREVLDGVGGAIGVIEDYRADDAAGRKRATLLRGVLSAPEARS
jgi:hypothetical protein